ncbi:MAG TPA: tetratricopeptide repeat protein [Gemmataceae bacterium]|jgi:hypothetical protein|nr:tetratricopeptide repeat protein [Gemmataceae bacterium]
MRRPGNMIAVLALLAAPAAVQAGLYYSDEVVAELPSQWRGFLLDQRLLRQIAIKPTGSVPASPARQRYRRAADKLARTARHRELTADESADLGALHVRLGEVDRAVDVLRAAQRRHPNHFQIVANLGTAWQVQGDLEQAAACLQEAVRLAPGKLQRAEEYQLKLVRLRRQQRDAQALDDLFGVRYVGDDGKYQPGKLGAAERKKLPSDAAAVVQRLALWLPADGRLLWQLAELAGAHGDVKTSASIMDGCVTEFGMRGPELLRHRRLARAAAEQAKKPTLADAKAAHTGHAGLLRPRSQRPLVSRLDQAALPPVRDTGVNALPWAVLTETSLDRKYRPTFSKYLRELDGKRITLDGYVQPLGGGEEMASFLLIEYPVGCWYCEMPDLTGIVRVDLAGGKTLAFTRSQVKITGTVTLNATDPESFLYTIRRAGVRIED